MYKCEICEEKCPDWLNDTNYSKIARMHKICKSCDIMYWTAERQLNISPQ
jgi:hypothetical protein